MRTAIARRWQWVRAGNAARTGRCLVGFASHVAPGGCDARRRQISNPRGLTSCSGAPSTQPQAASIRIAAVNSRWAAGELLVVRSAPRT